MVAAVHGPALGGGFELALACHAIVASDHPDTRFGLPEVHVGVMCAGNGALRVAGAAQGSRRRSTSRSAASRCAPRRRGSRASSTTSVRARSSSTRPPDTRRPSWVTCRASRASTEDLKTLAIEKNPIGRRAPLQEGARTARRDTRPLRCPRAHGRRPRALRREGVRRGGEARGQALRRSRRERGRRIDSSSSRWPPRFSTAAREIDEEGGVARPIRQVAVLGGGPDGRRDRLHDRCVGGRGPAQGEGRRDADA